MRYLVCFTMMKFRDRKFKFMKSSNEEINMHRYNNVNNHGRLNVLFKMSRTR